MAKIQPVTVNDNQAIAKVNAAIVKANKVDDKADVSALSALGDEIIVRPTFAQSVAPIRPGEAVSFFTAQLIGRPESMSPLPADSVAASDAGQVVALVGAGQIAPIYPWRIEPGRVFNIRFVVKRSVNTEDPSNDAVRLGVAWLKSDCAGAGTTDLANLLDITTDDGRLEFNFRLATAAANDIDAIPPTAGVYFRPFVKTFGSGITHVEVIEVTDATNSVAWSPNVDLLRREIAGLTARLQIALDRIEALEAAA